MSATVYADARYGIVKDEAATGLKLANLSYNASVSEAAAEDHVGQEADTAYYNDKINVSADGVVAVMGTGMKGKLASVISLANEDNGGVNLATSKTFTTPVAGAGVILTTLDVARNNKGFETGSMSGTYRPLVNTASPSVIT